MKLVSPETTDSMLVDRAEGRNIIHNYFGVQQRIAEGPQAYLVDMPDEGSRISPHYHDVDQYQVVVDGDGVIGPHPLRPVTYQYADAYTPYGPIIASKNGLNFYTLRMAPSGGHFDMPAARHLMKAKPGRSIAGTFDLKGPNDKTPAGQCVLEILHAPEPDGITAAGIRLGANATGKGIPSDAGGQYCIVCSGDVVHEGKHYPRLSLILVEAGEAAPVFAAGDQGAEILTVQFPRATARLGSDPKQLATRDMNALYHLPKTWLKDDVKH
jgi:hypothetical protein